MPLVEGGSLAAAIAHRHAAGDERQCEIGAWWEECSDSEYQSAVVGLLARVARALAVAHDRRVVHRDIKPANILLDRWDDGCAFLSDLGLGCGRDDPDTSFGSEQAGTLMYMPPEKLLRQETDETLADIYALGVTLYEALTLVHPRAVPEGVHRSCVPALLAASVPPRPCAVRPALPVALEAIILRAMAWEPSERYQSAADLAHDLDKSSL
jgi:serine/threonine-protein kinase